MTNQIRKVRRAVDALSEYMHILTLMREARVNGKPDRLGRSDEIALHAACVAMIDFVDDGDFLALRDQICSDNGWDAEGFPINEFGHRTGRPMYGPREETV